MLRIHDRLTVPQILEITSRMHDMHMRVCVPHNMELISKHGFTNREDGRDVIYLLMEEPFDQTWCYSPKDFDAYEHRCYKRRKINHLPS